jgi:hypothetical protein
MHNAGVEIDSWSTDIPVVGAQDLRHQQGNLSLQIHLGRADDMGFGDPGEGCDLGVEVEEVESECAREEVQEEVVLLLDIVVYMNQAAGLHDQVNLPLMTDSHYWCLEQYFQRPAISACRLSLGWSEHCLSGFGFVNEKPTGLVKVQLSATENWGSSETLNEIVRLPQSGAVIEIHVSDSDWSVSLGYYFVFVAVASANDGLLEAVERQQRLVVLQAVCAPISLFRLFD